MAEKAEPPVVHGPEVIVEVEDKVASSSTRKKATKKPPTIEP